MLWIGVAPQAFLQPSRQALETVLADFRQRVEEPEVSQATLRTRTVVPPGETAVPAPAAESSVSAANSETGR
jgi:hypothetical protein